MSEEAIESSFFLSGGGGLCDCGEIVQHLQNALKEQGKRTEVREVALDNHRSPGYSWSLIFSEGSSMFWRSQWSNAAQVVGLVGIAMALLSLIQVICRSRRALWQQLRCARAQGDGLQEKVMEVKVGQLRSLLQLFCYFLVPITAWSPFWTISTDLDRTVIISAAQALLSFFALKPQLISPRSFDAVYCLVAAILILAVTPWTCCDDQLLPMLGLTNGVMMAMVSVRRTMPGRVPVLLVTNLLFGLATSGTIFLKGRWIFLEWRWVFAAGQMLLMLLMTAAAPILEGRCRLWMYQLLELEELQESFAASQSLLRSCFDVVVELGEAGNIVSTGPELGALLLRDSTRQCMQGTNFMELLDEEEERQEFQRRLACSTARDLGFAESMQLSIKDACNNILRLEAMWYEYRRPGAVSRAKHYMLGLREAPEQSQPRHLVVSPADLPVEAFVHEVPETCSVSSGSSKVDEGAIIIIDVAADGWPVKEVTPSFRARVGRLRCGASFTCVVGNPDKFRLWLVRAAKARSQGAQPPRDCTVALKMPQGKIRARCKLAGSGTLDGASCKVELERVPLLLHSIRIEDPEQEGRAVPSRHRGTSPSSSMSSLDCGKVSEQAPVDGEADATLLLDAAASGWPVLKVSQAFQASAGHLSCGTSFQRVVSQPGSFRLWLSQGLKARARGEEPPANCVVLKMAQGRVKARCSLGGEGPVQASSVGLLFHFNGEEDQGKCESTSPMASTSCQRCSL